MTLLEWFDAAPIRYWAIAGICGALPLFLAFTAPEPGSARGRLHHPVVFAGACAAALAAFRWPMLFSGPLFNPDEMQLGSAGLTYGVDPVPWRSVDLHTSGPLDGYFLWPLIWAHGRSAYAVVRGAALLCHAATVLSCYGVLRRICCERRQCPPGRHAVPALPCAGETPARLGTLPLLAFLALCPYWDIDQYSSEQLPVALIGVGAWLIAERFPAETACRRRNAGWVGAGICLGSVPFAKMQVVPLAAAVAVLGLLAARGKSRTAFLVGLLAPAALFASVLTIFGLWNQFDESYLRANAWYASANGVDRVHFLKNFGSLFVDYVPGFAPFLWGTLAMGVVGTALALVRPAGTIDRRIAACVWGLLAVAWVSVIYPARQFEHYVQILLLPLGLLGGWSALSSTRLKLGPSAGAETWVGRVAQRVGDNALHLSILVVLVFQVISRTQQWHPGLGQLARSWQSSLHPVSARLAALAAPGDRLVVWGWFPRLYPESGLPQGVRDAHFEREIQPGPLLAFYRQRYLRDLNRHQPRFFVDAVCPGSFLYTDRDSYGPASFPGLNRYLADHYRLEEASVGCRIYVRSD